MKKSFLEKFNIDNDRYYNVILNIINTNKNKIIEQAQSYIKNYENGERVSFCTSIDKILLTLDEYELTQQIIELSRKQIASSNQEGQEVS